MKSVVCTLFEGHYHYGVAALINSLYSHGFRGAIYAGYRGSMPFWSEKASINPSLNWIGSRTLNVAEGLFIHFLPLDTDYHLTNYKPTFMLNVLRNQEKDVEAVAYFDPDIVIKCRWTFFEEWMTQGVALVHDITDNDMPESHPIRLKWNKVVSRYSREVRRKVNSYINAGFCGLLKRDIDFLKTWSFFIEKAITDYGMDYKTMTTYDKSFPFCYLDQDALNITAMCSTVDISEIGPSGMDLSSAGTTMSHALGSPKPWNKLFLRSALINANPPKLADKAFWLNVKGPIVGFTSGKIKIKLLSISIASLIGRFYRRS